MWTKQILTLLVTSYYRSYMSRSLQDVQYFLQEWQYLDYSEFCIQEVSGEYGVHMDLQLSFLDHYTLSVKRNTPRFHCLLLQLRSMSSDPGQVIFGHANLEQVAKKNPSKNVKWFSRYLPDTKNCSRDKKSMEDMHDVACVFHRFWCNADQKQWSFLINNVLLLLFNFTLHPEKMPKFSSYV